jgi:hypothetical protein
MRKNASECAFAAWAITLWRTVRIRSNTSSSSATENRSSSASLTRSSGLRWSGGARKACRIVREIFRPPSSPAGPTNAHSSLFADVWRFSRSSVYINHLCTQTFARVRGLSDFLLVYFAGDTNPMRVDTNMALTDTKIRLLKARKAPEFVLSSFSLLIDKDPNPNRTCHRRCVMSGWA